MGEKGREEEGRGKIGKRKGRGEERRGEGREFVLCHRKKKEKSAPMASGVRGGAPWPPIGFLAF